MEYEYFNILSDIRDWLCALFYLGCGWSLFYFVKWLLGDWR